MRGTCDPHLIRSENSFARVGVIHVIIPSNTLNYGKNRTSNREKYLLERVFQSQRIIIGEEEGGGEE